MDKKINGKKARTSEQTRRYILETAFWEVYVHGFNGVSINDIVAKTTITKGAFFHYFFTKNDLGYAIIDEILQELTLQRWVKPLESYENPIEGISKQLKKIITDTSMEDLSLGCPLNNLTQELSGVDPIFSSKIQRVLKLWINGIECYLKKAKDMGYIKPEFNPKQIAEFVVMAHEGAFGMSKGLKSKKVLWSLSNSLKTYLDFISK